MSPTERQKQRERDSGRALSLQRLSLLVAVIAVSVSAGSLWWQVQSTRSQKRSYGEQMEAVKASLRLLTATVAPQLLKAVDDNLVSALSDDSQSATSALNKVADDTQQLRKLKAKLPLSQVADSASKLNQAVARHSGLLATWQATAELVSYRSELYTPERDVPNCFDSHSAGTANPSVVKFSDCSLDLNALEQFKPFIETITQKKEDGTVVSGSITMFLMLDHVIVRYNGGEMIPITGFQCIGCAFVIGRPSAVPPVDGRVMTQTLLTANLDKTLIALPKG